MRRGAVTRYTINSRLRHYYVPRTVCINSVVQTIG